jgi:hypothetical protein
LVQKRKFEDYKWGRRKIVGEAKIGKERFYSKAEESYREPE